VNYQKVGSLKITTLNQDYLGAVLTKSGEIKNLGKEYVIPYYSYVLCFVYFVTNKTFLTIFSSSIVFKNMPIILLN
jgi:hypothetical protein